MRVPIPCFLLMNPSRSKTDRQSLINVRLIPKSFARFCSGGSIIECEKHPALISCKSNFVYFFEIDCLFFISFILS